MNDPEKVRCEEYSRAIFGKSVKTKDLEDLVKGSASFEDFRIRVVHKCSKLNDHTKQVVVRWQSTLAKPANVPDANILLHMLEGLSLKQTDLERKLREANAELLSRLQALDAAATGQAAWRFSLDEMREQIAVIRRNLAQLEELPATGGNFSK